MVGDKGGEMGQYSKNSGVSFQFRFTLKNLFWKFEAPLLVENSIFCVEDLLSKASVIWLNHKLET